jgi:hypothetical protein
MFKKILENRLTNCQTEFQQVSEEATDLLSQLLTVDDNSRISAA